LIDIDTIYDCSVKYILAQMTTTVLAINPGSTSTEVGLFGRDGELWREDIVHNPDQLAPDVVDQLDYRRAALAPVIEKVEAGQLAAIAARGGPLKPMPGGTYLVNEAMLADYQAAKYANHASNLGALMADQIGATLGVKSYIVDPVTTDEFDAESRISGVPEIERRCRSHALNIKEVGRITAVSLGKDFVNTNLVVCHMGGGISVAALRGGKIVDVNDALLGMGPFSPERAGALPLEGLLKLAFSGEYTYEELKHKLSRAAGFKAYLGTNDLAEVVTRFRAGDALAHTIYRALVRQIAKEIGAMSTVLKGRLDGIVLTGGMAKSETLVADLTERINFIGAVTCIPGSLELEALATGVWRILENIETVKTYG